jgi:ATP-dependent DNA helicase DinG
LTPVDILGADGSIAKRLERYELREEQLKMAEAVNRAFIDKRHLLVEAGTGVGKSFAYLIPAILQTAGNQNDQIKDDKLDSFLSGNTEAKNPQSENSEIIVTKNESSMNDEFDYDIPFENDSFENYYDTNSSDQFDPQPQHLIEFPRVVISTHTISLQEQIMEKDIPFLRSVLPFEFTAVLVKGRSNYLCLRRFQSALQKSSLLFDDFQQRQFERLRSWAASTDDGSKSSLVPEPDWEIWAEICCETGNCMGKKCKSYKDCFYGKARRRVANAQILVVNHALFFSDLALRMQSGGILPVYNMLVFDEAHTISQVAADHIGISVTQYQVEYNLHRLYNSGTQKGLLTNYEVADKNKNAAAKFAAHIKADRRSGEIQKNNETDVSVEMDKGELCMIVDDCLARSEIFFGELADWLSSHPGSNGRVRKIGVVRNLLSEGLSKLMEKLRRMIERLGNPNERQEFRAVRDKITSIRDDIDSWITQSLQEESVYWLEVKKTSHGKQRVSINASPIDIGPILRKHIFGQIQSVIMTSATLTTS